MTTPATSQLLVALAALLLVSGCGLGPSLCLREPWKGAFTVGSTVDLEPGQRDVLDECDRPPPPDLEWSSSDPSVASVTNIGVVRAVAPGDVEISVRSGLAVARWEVTVFPLIGRIAIEPADATLVVGDTALYRAMAYGTDGTPLPEAPVSIFPQPDTAAVDPWVVYPLDLWLNLSLPIRERQRWGLDESGFNSAHLHAKRPGRVQIGARVYGFEDSTAVTVVGP